MKTLLLALLLVASCGIETLRLYSIKASLPNGSVKSMLVCTTCLRSGFVRKAVKHKPFKLGPQEKAKTTAKTAAKAKA